MSASQATPAYSGPFHLDLNVVTNEYDVGNVVIFTSNPTANVGTAAGQFFIPAGPSAFQDPAVTPGAYYDTKVLVIGIAGDGGTETASHTGGLVLFTTPSVITGSFNAAFPPFDETTLIGDLTTETDAGDVRLNNFASTYIAAYGFTVGTSFSITAFTDAELVGAGTSSFTAVGTTPLPGALPLFASGLGMMGFWGWRRKRKPAA